MERVFAVIAVILIGIVVFAIGQSIVKSSRENSEIEPIIIYLDNYESQGEIGYFYAHQYEYKRDTRHSYEDDYKYKEDKKHPYSDNYKYKKKTKYFPEKENENDEEDEENLEILRHSLEERGFFGLFVKGIAKNTGDNKIDYAQINVKFYDKDKEAIGSSFANTINLEPGEKWEFKVNYFGTQDDEVDYYTISTETAQ